MKNKAQNKFPKDFVFFDFFNTLKTNKNWELKLKNIFWNTLENGQEGIRKLVKILLKNIKRNNPQNSFI